MKGEPGVAMMCGSEAPEGRVIPTDMRSLETDPLAWIAPAETAPVAPECSGSTTNRTVTDALAECCASAEPWMTGTTTRSRRAASVRFLCISIVNRSVSV